jgi:hypothetical protein
MKSVQNLIVYLHKFFWNFFQFLAICFELLSFGVIFNSENADERAPPVRRRPWLKAAVGTARRRRPGRLTDHAVAQTAAPAASPLARRRRFAVPAPVSRRSSPSPMRRRRAHVGSPSSAVRRTGWPSWAAPAPCTRAVPLMSAGRAAHALCIWAERGFDPVALKLIFIFF